MNEEEHKAYHRRIFYVLMLILFILLGGATFYHYVEGWRCLDALYFSTVTMTTIGYGDFSPQTDLGKIFTIFYVFASVGVALYGLGLLGTHLVELREEAWLQKLRGARIRHHTGTYLGKLNKMFTYHKEKLIKGYEKQFPSKNDKISKRLN